MFQKVTINFPQADKQLDTYKQCKTNVNKQQTGS